MKPLIVLTAGTVAIATVSSLLTPQAQAAAFTPGDALIYRVGNGTETLSNTGNSVFIDEYSPTGTLVQTITVDDTGSNALLSSGTASSEGLLNYNNGYLSFAGYNRAVGGTGSVVSTAGTAVPRIVDVYNADGTFGSATKLTDFATANNPRSATTIDGTNLILGGAAGGVRTTTVGSTTSTQINATATTNVREVNVFNGTTYFDLSSTSVLGATGIYSASGGTQTQIVATSPTADASTTAGNSPYGFAFAKLNAASTGPDTLYVADNNLNGIEKYSLVNGTWTATGTITGLTGVTGLSLATSGTTVTLYATTPTTLYIDTDASGQGGTLTGAATAIATAAASEAFRGVADVTAAVAVPEPTTILGGVLLVAAGAWSQRRQFARLLC